MAAVWQALRSKRPTSAPCLFWTPHMVAKVNETRVATKCGAEVVKQHLWREDQQSAMVHAHLIKREAWKGLRWSYVSRHPCLSAEGWYAGCFWQHPPAIIGTIKPGHPPIYWQHGAVCRAGTEKQRGKLHDIKILEGTFELWGSGALSESVARIGHQENRIGNQESVTENWESETTKWESSTTKLESVASATRMGHRNPKPET